ncbi:hypothetical protein GGI21_006326 [Coemansia aciculifera]|nr:hypothetical protein GGI21_006326 [Coemansia aciculifera]
MRASQDIIAANSDNCQKDACRRDNCANSSNSSSSISLSPTLWEASQAQEAHKIVLSIERRYARLLKLMQVLNFHSQNPLGGAMCAEYQNRIHQMALLINGEITNLKRMVGECELRLTRSASSQSRSSSLAADWEEIHALSNSSSCCYGDDDDDTAAANEGSNRATRAESPPANNLSTIRFRLLSDVNTFFTTELAHIKASLSSAAVQQTSSCQLH